MNVFERIALESAGQFDADYLLASDTQITTEATAQMLELVIMDSSTNDEISAYLESTEFQEDCTNEIAMERTIVKLDKQAKLSRFEKIAIFQIADEKKDPLMKKLKTLWKLEAAIERKLAKKYGAEGARRARVMLKGLSAKGSSFVKNATAKVQAKAGTVFKKQNSIHK